MNLVSEVRATIRRLWRNPFLFGLVVLTLTIGIGATTAVFAVVDALLIRTLPYPNAERLTEIWTQEAATGRGTPGLKGDVVRALREQRQVFAAVEVYHFGSATLTGSGEPALVSAPRVSPGLLHLLGVVPRLGRLFHEDDATPGARAVLISERLWTMHFGAAVSVLGRRLSIDDEPHTIVGVLPRAFAFPEQRADVWLPVAIAPGSDSGRLQTIAAVRPELSRETLADRLRTITGHLHRTGTLSADRKLTEAELLQRRYVRRHSKAFYLMLAAVALLWFVALMNVTNLLLARAAARESEFALMGALGATRSDLLRHLVSESVVLAVLGGTGALLFARLVLAGILQIIPPQLTFLSSAATAIDWRVLVFATLLSGVPCVTIGVVQTFRVSRVDLIQSLKARAPGVAAAHEERWQSVLIVAQLAGLVVLLACGGLLLRSFVRLINIEPGFESSHLLVFEIQLPEHRYAAPGVALTFFEQLDGLVEGSTGVRHATFSEGAPPTGGAFSFDIAPEAEGRQRVDASGLELPHTRVASDYFVAMGIPILDGRTFQHDDPGDVVIVNDRLARRFWGADSPVGCRFRLDVRQPWHTVVAVAGDVKQMGLDDPMGDGMEVYFPYVRNQRARFFSFIVRTSGNDVAVARRVKEHVWALDPRLPIIEVQTMDQRLAESVSKPRFFLGLVSVFSGLGVLLAGVGVYGTTAYWATRRKRELAIRMALGATRQSLAALVLGRGLKLAVYGAGLGLAAALASLRVLESLLFATSAHDAVTLVSVGALLAALVLVACYLPARRAGRVDPCSILRGE